MQHNLQGVPSIYIYRKRRERDNDIILKELKGNNKLKVTIDKLNNKLKVIT